MSQDLRKKIINLHKKGEGYKKISNALLISQNTVAKVVQTFKKDGTATISQRRPGRPRKLTPRQELLLMRRVEEYQHASSLQLSKKKRKKTFTFSKSSSFSLSFSPSLASMYLFEQCLRLGVIGTSSVCLPLQD